MTAPVSPTMAAFVRRVHAYYDKRPPTDEVILTWEDALKGQQMGRIESAYTAWLQDTTKTGAPRAADLLAIIRHVQPRPLLRREPVTLSDEDMAEGRLRAAVGQLLLGYDPARMGIPLQPSQHAAALRVFEEWESAGSDRSVLLSPSGIKALCDRAVRLWREGDLYPHTQGQPS